MEAKIDRLLDTSARMDERTKAMAATVKEHDDELRRLSPLVDRHDVWTKAIGALMVAGFPVIFGFIATRVWG